MTMPAAPDGILETLTVVVSLDVQQPRTQGSLCAGPGTTLDVQQDYQKAELKCTGLCSCCEWTHFPDQNTDENNLSDDDNDGGLAIIRT
jgi:hypothetical protein